MKMAIIESIKTDATSMGACNKIGAVTDIASLVSLFFSPQGKEFCQDNNFPSLEAFQELDGKYNISKYGVYVDSDEVLIKNKQNIALIGETQATVVYDGVAYKYTIILMHGAKATITARNHAVIEVINVDDCQVTYDLDKTVVLL